MEESSTYSTYLGTKQFHIDYDIPQSSQSLLRKNGMPFHRLPNSTKILYCREEIELWLAKGKINGQKSEIKIEEHDME